VGFYGLDAQQYYTTLVNAFKQLFKSVGGVLLFFSLPCTLIWFLFVAPLTSHFICVHALLGSFCCARLAVEITCLTFIEVWNMPSLAQTHS